MSKAQPEAGQIYYADLGPPERERLLVVSSDELNLNPSWLNVICVHLTSKHLSGGPWIELPSQGGRTVANCTEMLTIRKARLRDRIKPDVSLRELEDVYRGIALALGAEPTFRKTYGSP